MPVTENYLNYVIDLLDEAGPVEARRMFGGAGLYLNGLFFALIADDVLYFKVDESNRGDYEKAGMGPFSPFGRYSMGYYRVPVGVMEDGRKLKEWAQKSLSVAARKGAAAKKKKKTKKAGPLIEGVFATGAGNTLPMKPVIFCFVLPIHRGITE